MSCKLRRDFNILFVFVFSVTGCNILDSGSEQPPKPVSATYEYWVTGGYAGSVEHTVFDSTGLAQLSYVHSPGSPASGYTYRLTGGEFDSLRSAFESANFFSLNSSYTATQRIMDGFNHRIACNFDSASKTVAVEANASIPAVLENLLGVLNNLNTTIQSKGQKS